MTSVALSLRADGSLSNQTFETYRSAKCQISRTPGNNVCLKTNPQHSWDAKDLIQLSQAMLYAAIALHNEESGDRVALPVFSNIAAFNVVLD